MSSIIDDHSRPLSDTGKEDASTLAKYICDNKIYFDLTLCSTSDRTRETLTIIKDYSTNSFQEINYLDELYNAALEIVKSERKASTSFLQRKLQIGYNRAARIIDQKEINGEVSKANHVGKREVIK